MLKKINLFVLILLVSIIQIEAQNYSVRSLGVEQGLSCNYVVSMAQDKYGFLWFATEEGLNRFDGNRFFSYYKRNGEMGLSSSELNCVIDDAKETILWIGMDLIHITTRRDNGDAICIMIKMQVVLRPMTLLTSNMPRMGNSG